MTIVETLEVLGECIEFSYHLVRDEFDGHKGPTTWSCSITCNSKSYTTEYTKGCGHRVYTDLHKKPTDMPVVIPMRAMSIFEMEQNKASVPVPPDLMEFMSCLVSDAGCVRDADFEEFCSEFGYSDDSISARKSYDACCDTYMALNRMGLDLEQLFGLYEDY